MNNSNKSSTIGFYPIKISALILFLAIGIGAFGAHGLKHLMNEYQKAIFEKGIFYHIIHGLAIMGVGLLVLIKPQLNKMVKWVIRFFTLGIVFFSGSLYLLALQDIVNLPTWFGIVTPLGGLSYILGWAFLFFGIPKSLDK